MKRVTAPLRILAFALVVAGLAACASKEREEYVERPVEQLYNEGVNALATDRYLTAARAFDEVERQHPYSTWATKAQLMAAYAHYQANKYDDAIVAVDRFIQLNPSNRDVGYAYYLKAISYYEQITDVQRDARMTELAMGALEEVVRRFPDTPFARDARLKIDLTNDHLAGKEMEVGRFYMRRGQYVGAINRFKLVLDRFQTTSHVPEALHRLVEAYTALGLSGEAEKAAAILGHNYPGSDWYQDSYGLVTTGRTAEAAQPGIARRLLRSLNPF
ncbi:MAG: outer membrane protein assembly factor BamD [Alphaproteobacteria bacterium]|nr:outer membrane protein assembly factor BamD [Alphaproteobacteria bacterium]